jgi:target of rapamycin complex 2 subunit MAPKAP1
LRLQYIRNVEDPYAARLITLSPSYTSNPYIQAAGLADVERWPELAAPVSPAPSDDEGASTARPGPSGFPGARGLKYSTTIMGPSRVGSVGMRVSGKRSSTYRPRSIRTQLQNAALRPEESPPDSAATAIANGPARQQPDLVHKTSNQALSIATTAVDEPSPNRDDKGKDEAPKPSLFIPKFKMAADMEARRRQRMVARAQFRAPQPAANLDPEASSSEDEGPRPIPESSSSEMSMSEGEEEDYDEVPDAGDDLASDADEFDPFVPSSRIPQLLTDLGVERLLGKELGIPHQCCRLRSIWPNLTLRTLCRIQGSG